MAKTNWGKWEYIFDNDYPREYESIGGGIKKCDLMNVRYVLGEEFIQSERKSEKTMICIGLNPSTAVPKNLDLTVGRVRKYALGEEYRAWYMLNIYPYRETDSELIPKEIDKQIAEKNLKEIKRLTDLIEEADIWCAWGNVVDNRPDLRDCLRDILNQLQTRKDYNFLQRIPINKDQATTYPLHPIASIKCDAKLGGFDINKYLETLKK